MKSLFNWKRQDVARAEGRVACLINNLTKQYDWPLTHHERNADIAELNELSSNIKQVKYLHDTGTPWRD